MDDERYAWLMKRLKVLKERIAEIKNKALPPEERARRASQAGKDYWTPERVEEQRQLYYRALRKEPKPKRSPEELYRVCSEAGKAYWTEERREEMRQLKLAYYAKTQAERSAAKEAREAERAKAKAEAKAAKLREKRKRAGIVMPSDFLANPEAYLKPKPLAETPSTSTSPMIAQLHAMREELHGVEFDPEMDDEALMEKLLAEEELE